ncbi:multiple coagulation factor deficiency protein 2 homolog [Anopheles marshallii]|uniref:multiple coagulation factor deficiency protein 2 homolog n=1 Tax=Anopheles marshallii TaxID=1521116 RepID=UPI00237A8ED6|nr:multiple coagulation factor deficiency protein 2 homolog [Anopheles marshallii]
MSFAYRNSFLLHYIVLCTTLIQGPVATAGAKGPHHPGGEFSRRSEKLHLDDHLQPEREHLEDDLKRLPIGEQSLTEMSEDEKNFYYFKLHDSDNNDNLDGLEMLHAATHHHSKAEGQLHGIDSNSKHTPDDRSPFLEDEEFNHIIEVIDDFIEFADTDKNGLLNYPEYINAINLNDPKNTHTTVDTPQEPNLNQQAANSDVPTEIFNTNETDAE